MKSMFFADIFNAKIICDEFELYWSSFVFPKAWDELTLVVAAFVELFFKEFVGGDSWLRQFIHAAVGEDIY